MHTHTHKQTSKQTNKSFAMAYSLLLSGIDGNGNDDQIQCPDGVWQMDFSIQRKMMFV